MLEPIAKGVWVAHTPHVMMGLHLGTRMTVVRLADGLWVHSPIGLGGGLREAVDALGEVRHVVAPNVYHHMYVPEAMAAWPDATLHAPASLRKKRRDLDIHRTLSEERVWGDALEPLTIDGCMLEETVFFHPSTRTLVTSDLTENFQSCDHLPTRLYLKASGTYGKVGWPRPLRLLYRDRRAARASVERLLAWDFDRVVIAHGTDILREGAKDAVRRTFEFL